MEGFQDGDQVFLSYVSNRSYAEDAKGHVYPATILAAEHGLVEVHGAARVLNSFEQVSATEFEAWHKCADELDDLARRLQAAAADCRGKAGHAKRKEIAA
jgi:hypothetical protein